MSEPELVAITKRYLSKGVLVDSNLLLLLLVGTYKRNLVGSFKRLDQYSQEDFVLLVDYLDLFPGKLVTTPNILTEVSNLAGLLNTSMHDFFTTTFSHGLKELSERYVESKSVANDSSLLWLHLTDVAMLPLLDEYLLLTDDAKLYRRALALGKDAVNFTNLRGIELLQGMK